MKKAVISITFLMLFCCTFFDSATARDFKKDEIAYAASFISEYGKDNVVGLIQSERKGRITLIIDNELIDSSGRPNTDYVTAYTVCIDVNKIGWNLLEFKDKLWENASKPQAKTKKKVRRFTENSTLDDKVELKSLSSNKTSNRSQSPNKDNSRSQHTRTVSLAEIKRVSQNDLDRFRELLEKARSKTGMVPDGNISNRESNLGENKCGRLKNLADEYYAKQTELRTRGDKFDKSNASSSDIESRNRHYKEANRWHNKYTKMMTQYYNCKKSSELSDERELLGKKEDRYDFIDFVYFEFRKDPKRAYILYKDEIELLIK